MPTLKLELPEHVVEQCEESIERTEFDSVEEYISFIVEQVIETTETSVTDTRTEEQEVESQLEALGYK